MKILHKEEMLNLIEIIAMGVRGKVSIGNKTKELL